MAYYLYEPDKTSFEEFVSLALKDQGIELTDLSTLNSEFDNILYHQNKEIYIKRANNTNYYETIITGLEPSVKFTSTSDAMYLTDIKGNQLGITRGMLFTFFQNYPKFKVYLKEDLYTILTSLPRLSGFEHILERKNGNMINTYTQGINIWTVMKITNLRDRYSIGWDDKNIFFNLPNSTKVKQAFKKAVLEYLSDPGAVINQMQSVFLQYKYKDNIIVKKFANTPEILSITFDLYDMEPQEWLYLDDKSIDLTKDKWPVKKEWNQLITYNITDNDKKFYTYKFEFDGFDIIKIHNPVELSYEEYMSIIHSHNKS